MEKHFRKIIMMGALAATMGLTSCKQYYYQVYEVKSDALTQQDNSLVYENADLKVMYNLWDNNGSVGFILQSKGDKDLFIDLDRTFFVLNGHAKDYFKNREWTETSSSTITNSYGISQTYWSLNGFWPTRYYVPTTQSALTKLIKGQSNGVTTKEKDIICIPAHTYKVIEEYNVSPTLVQTCDEKRDYPKHTANIANYTKSNSPLKFENRIAYSFDADCKDVKIISNDFYVNGITNYSKKDAVEKVKEKANCYDRQKVKREYFKIGGPNKFYQTYEDRSIR
ncbi:MAG: hypothetical protein ACOYJG_10800 [Prevotella sp.]|jgi:hypothetical protein